MANNPKFNFYVNDFEGGTRHMTDEELGCYMRLLLAQFNMGTLPNDSKFLSRLCDSLERSWPIVKNKFVVVDNGNLKNERLDFERIKSIEYSKSRKENRQKEKDIKNISKTYDKHMGNGKGNGINTLRGVEFFENNLKVKFDDGTYQELGETQLFMLSQSQLRPRDVFKGNSY